MTNPTTPEAPRPALWQHEPCPPWCERVHADDDEPDARTHYGPEHDIPLRHERAVRHFGGGWYLETLKVYLMRGYRDAETLAHVGRGECIGMVLGLDELEQAANEMLALVREARQPSVTG